MPQLSLYVGEAAMVELREGAAAAGCSLSKYVAGVLESHRSRSAYPEGYFDLYGSLAGEGIARPVDPAPTPVEPLF